MTYPVSPNESERLSALKKLHILDTGAELPFETLTAIARVHFATPIVAISLVDDHRQWFKSHPGLGACQTDRDLAFCNYTILSDDIYEVTDAADHPNFRENALVTDDPNIRYYCGAPIVVNDMRIGAFCVIDYKPRPAISDADRELLKGLAFLTAHIIITHRIMRESANSLIGLLK